MMRKRYALFVFIILFFTSQSRPALASPDDNLRKELDSYVLSAVEEGFSGAVLVAKKDRNLLFGLVANSSQFSSIPTRQHAEIRI
jgi:hypothetical protein